MADLLATLREWVRTLPLLGPFLLRKSGLAQFPPPVPIPPFPTTEEPRPGQIITINPKDFPTPVGFTPTPQAVALLHGPQTVWWDNAYPVSQPYGCTSFPVEGHNPHHNECPYFHEGIDFALPCGTPLYAGRQVWVVEIDPPGYGPPGNSAALHLRDMEDSPDWDIWLYHMADYAVSPKQLVGRNVLLGHSGTRGISTGCHVHFEVRPAGAPYRLSRDPRFLLFAPGLFTP